MNDAPLLPTGGTEYERTLVRRLQAIFAELAATINALPDRGTATLVGGTVTVPNTRVSSSSQIFVSVRTLGTVAAAKGMKVGTITAGTSFVITSTDATDTSVVDWLLYQ